MGGDTGVGKRLREARKAARLSQIAAGRLAGVHHVSISRWESGRSIGTDDLAKLARAYGRTVPELVGGMSAGGSNHSHTATDASQAADASEPGAAGSPPVPEEQSSPLYWRGRQDECVRTMEYISQSLRQAIAAHDRTLATQREIIANTTPQPRPSAVISGGTPQQRPAERTKRAAKRRPG